MSRRSTKKFEFGKGIYYFNILTGGNSAITIKRENLDKAIDAYNNYLKTQRGKCEWLGKWDGKKFIDSNFEKLNEATMEKA